VCKIVLAAQEAGSIVSGYAVTRCRHRSAAPAAARGCPHYTAIAVIEGRWKPMVFQRLLSTVTDVLQTFRRIFLEQPRTTTKGRGGRDCSANVKECVVAYSNVATETAEKLPRARARYYWTALDGRGLPRDPRAQQRENPAYQTETKPGSFRALPSKVAVARQPSRRLRASIKQSAKSAAESFQE
jgi:hypothetical protein